LLAAPPRITPRWAFLDSVTGAYFRILSALPSNVLTIACM
jgi:hypothetical protein